MGVATANLDESRREFAWELTHGPIPAGMFICHHCDNPPCVRPDHLFVGTPRDNMDDMWRKGRGRTPRGEEYRSAKLTEEKVRTARALYATGEISATEISRRMGVNSETLRSALRGKTWRHV